MTTYLGVFTRDSNNPLITAGHWIVIIIPRKELTTQNYVDPMISHKRSTIADCYSFCELIDKWWMWPSPAGARGARASFLMSALNFIVQKTVNSRYSWSLGREKSACNIFSKKEPRGGGGFGLQELNYCQVRDSPPETSLAGTKPYLLRLSFNVLSINSIT